MIVFKIVSNNSPEYKESQDFRYRLLRKPLNLYYSKEDLLQEKDDIHICGFLNNRLIAYAALRPITITEIKLRQVAISTELQGQGCGKKLVEFAEQIAANSGYKEITLHSRESVIGFYEKLGYKLISEKFIEVTVPHYKMKKIIKTAYQI